MAGKRQPKREATAARRGPEETFSLEEALHATQSHTVPVLPAFDPPTAPTPSRLTRARLARAAQDTADAARDQQDEPSPSVAPMPAQSLTSPLRTVSAAHTGATAGNISAITARPTTQGPAVKKTRKKAPDGDTRASMATAETQVAPQTPGAVQSAPPADETQPTRALVSLANDVRALAPHAPPERSLAIGADPDATTAIFIPGASARPRLYLTHAPRRQRPRPFLAQFFVAMMGIMTLSTVLTLSSPLGHSLTFDGSFQGYANAIPWIPTPTPTPLPTPTPQVYSPPLGANPGQQVIINYIVAVFGPYAQGALNIARCESGYDPNAYNSYAIGDSHAEGVFQILYPSTWSGTSYVASSPYNYVANINAAHEIFSRDGYSWREWECKPY